MHPSCRTSVAEFALSDTYRKDGNTLFSTQKDAIFIADYLCVLTPGDLQTMTGS